MTTLKLSRLTNEFETKSFFFQSLDGSDQCVATSVVSLDKYYDFLGTNIPGDEVEKIHLRGHVVHLCFNQSVVTDLCLYNWSFSFLE